jgi:hypothetical protein
MLGVEPLHFTQFDVGVFGPVHGSTGNPPLRTGQACGQVCASPGIMSLLRSTTLGNDFAVSRLPKRVAPASLPSTTASYQRHTTASGPPGTSTTATR